MARCPAAPLRPGAHRRGAGAVNELQHLPLRAAVVGHTNAGKTSLLRTLTRNVRFGEVSDRPGTTRDVEGCALKVGGRSVLELFDTPGLEDSIALLDLIESSRSGHRIDGVELIGS